MMFHHVSLSILCLCVGIGYVQCGPMSWGDGGHDDWTDSEHDLEGGMKDGMSQWMEMDMEEHKDKDMGMKHKKPLKMLGQALKKDGASDHYSMDEWKALLKHIVFSHKNRQDPVIDMSQECTMKVSAKFWAPEMEIPLCGLVYTLPEVHEALHMEGGEIIAATNRHKPEVHITDLHGEPVHDGLYTMVWVDRGDSWPTDGDFDTPFLHWMIINIPGCDVAKGNTIKSYLPSSFSHDFQVFVYEQHDHIHEDFAIGDYTISSECRYQHRCHFQQAEFVAAYYLKQRAVGHFTIHPDPFTTHLDMSQGFSTAHAACIDYLDEIIPEAFEYFKVDTTDKMAMKMAFKKYTGHYICHEKLEDEHTRFLLKAQFGSLVNKFINNFKEDALVPNHVEFYYDIGLKFWAEADSVELCGVSIDLPEVHRKFWLEDDKWDDGSRVHVWAAEVRNAPHVKIAERESLTNPPPSNHLAVDDNLFTLLIVITSYVGESQLVASAERPYIYWMVTNIKGDNVEHGDEIVPYLTWARSNDTQVFLYRQQYTITDLPMVQYTEGKCRSENRCWFDQPRFVWDYDLELVGGGRFDISRDAYGFTYPWRRGNRSANYVCDTYLEAKKEEGEEHSADTWEH